MAQNNGLIIGIIAVLVIGGAAWYILNTQSPTTTNNQTPTAFAQQNKAVLQAAQVAVTPQGKIILSELFNMSDAQLQQLEDVADDSSSNGSINAFNSILLFTAQAATKQHELQALATQIAQIPGDAYCAQLSLFTARDQAGSEMIQLLEKSKQSITQFSTNYPELAATYGLTPETFDYSAAAAEQAEREKITQSLQSSCQGAN